MNYLKKLLLSLRELFLIMLIQYVLLIVCILIFGVSMTIIIGSIVLAIFEIGYVTYIYRKDKKMIGYKNSYFPFILLGISISVIFNMITFKLGIKSSSSINNLVLISIFTSGIIGPIFEEVLFRYRLISKLERFNSNKFIIILLSGIIFGLCHTNIVTIIYATIVGLINSYFYLKYKNIIIPIVIHMSGNIISDFLIGYNTWILILGIILLIVSTLLINDKRSYE